MDFKKLAEKYFKSHNEPLLRIELPPRKFFLESPNDHEEEIKIYQDNLTKSLEYVRVERRCSRSKGIWESDIALCKVTKVVGNLLKNFGFQDKSGIYLLPEETLFLIEQNKLELTVNTEQISIYEAYSLITNHVTLKKYRVYKYLVEQGFKLLNTEAIKKFYFGQKKHSQDASKKKKRERTDRDDDQTNEVKKRRIYSDLAVSSSNIEKTQKQIDHNFTELFEKLRRKGPKLVLPCQASRHPDYFGFLPSSRCKHNHEFQLYIREEIDPKDFENYEHIPNIFAICTNDNISFCRYPNVNIPIIN